MRTVFSISIALLIATLVFPAASADCTTTSGTFSVATVRLTDQDTECSFAYSGTGYTSSSEYTYSRTAVSESTTGASVNYQEYSGSFQQNSLGQQSHGDYSGGSVGVGLGNSTTASVSHYRGDYVSPTYCYQSINLGSSAYAVGMGTYQAVGGFPAPARCISELP